ncbi:MAG: regulatory protein RecX [Mariprofundaceae bacterium]|nr:regulatory protein RecX [Mariprofundaceae bacterium]
MHPEVKAAYSAALRWITLREYCETELLHKLRQKNFDEIAAESAIEQLKHYGYVSDMRYAEALFRYRLKKGDTPWMIAEKARQKGVNEEALQQALQAVEEVYDAKEACLALLRKRDPEHNRRHDAKIWQRQARYLRNKGFDAATIMDALNGENED